MYMRIADLSTVPADSKVDLRAVVVECESDYTVSKTGVNKKNVQIADESNAKVKLTLFGDASVKDYSKETVSLLKMRGSLTGTGALSRRRSTPQSKLFLELLRSN